MFPHSKKLFKTQLPQKEEFYSHLNDEHVSDDDYQHAINVWSTFNCKSIRDYHDLYLKSDVLLLADVFENFRKTCLHHYKLDPAHSYTSPGLAWHACSFHEEFPAISSFLYEAYYFEEVVKNLR